jgi:cell division protein FtsB
MEKTKKIFLFLVQISGVISTLDIIMPTQHEKSVIKMRKIISAVVSFELWILLCGWRMKMSLGFLGERPKKWSF